MAKKVNKSKPKRRLSVLERTIEEGKAFVEQATKIYNQTIRKNNKKPEPLKKIVKKSRKVSPRPQKKSKPNKAQRKKKTLIKPSSSFNSSAPLVQGGQASRTQSRANIAQVGRTSSRNSQVIEQ